MRTFWDPNHMRETERYKRRQREKVGDSVNKPFSEGEWQGVVCACLCMSVHACTHFVRRGAGIKHCTIAIPQPRSQCNLHLFSRSYSFSNTNPDCSLEFKISVFQIAGQDPLASHEKFRLWPDFYFWNRTSMGEIWEHRAEWRSVLLVRLFTSDMCVPDHTVKCISQCGWGSMGWKSTTLKYLYWGGWT